MSLAASQTLVGISTTVFQGYAALQLSFRLAVCAGMGGAVSPAAVTITSVTTENAAARASAAAAKTSRALLPAPRLRALSSDSVSVGYTVVYVAETVVSKLGGGGSGAAGSAAFDPAVILAARVGDGTFASDLKAIATAQGVASDIVGAVSVPASSFAALGTTIQIFNSISDGPTAAPTLTPSRPPPPTQSPTLLAVPAQGGVIGAGIILCALVSVVAWSRSRRGKALKRRLQEKEAADDLRRDAGLDMGAIYPDREAGGKGAADVGFYYSGPSGKFGGGERGWSRAMQAQRAEVVRAVPVAVASPTPGHAPSPRANALLARSFQLAAHGNASNLLSPTRKSPHPASASRRAANDMHASHIAIDFGAISGSGNGKVKALAAPSASPSAAAASLASHDPRDVRDALRRLARIAKTHPHFPSSTPASAAVAAAAAFTSARPLGLQQAPRQTSPLFASTEMLKHGLTSGALEQEREHERQRQRARSREGHQDKEREKRAMWSIKAGVVAEETAEAVPKTSQSPREWLRRANQWVRQMGDEIEALDRRDLARERNLALRRRFYPPSPPPSPPALSPASAPSPPPLSPLSAANLRKHRLLLHGSPSNSNSPPPAPPLSPAAAASRPAAVARGGAFSNIMQMLPGRGRLPDEASPPVASSSPSPSRSSRGGGGGGGGAGFFAEPLGALPASALVSTKPPPTHTHTPAPMPTPRRLGQARSVQSRDSRATTAQSSSTAPTEDESSVTALSLVSAAVSASAGRFWLDGLDGGGGGGGDGYSETRRRLAAGGRGLGFAQPSAAAARGTPGCAPEDAMPPLPLDFDSASALLGAARPMAATRLAASAQPRSPPPSFQRQNWQARYSEKHQAAFWRNAVTGEVTWQRPKHDAEI